MKTPEIFITILIAAILSMAFGSLAQTPQHEDLLKKVEISTGQDQVLALNELCKLFYATNPEKGIAYGERARSLADYPKVRGYFDEAYRSAVTYNDSLEIGTYYNRLGLMFEN